MADVTNKLDDMWKENIKEWVYEETKIVTYKWLSKQISVHVNIAKQMLYEFVQSNQNSQSPIEIVYLLAGRIALPPHSVKVCLVKSKDLSSKEAEFQSITSKHIYAISKSQPGLLKETNVCQVDLSIRNKDEGNDTNFSKYSAIGNKKAVPNRLPNFDKGYVVPKTESKSNLPKNEPTSKIPDDKKNGVQKMFDKQISNAPNKSAENKVIDKEVSKGKQKTETKKVAAKGSGIAGMFAKAAAKQTTTTAIKKETLNDAPTTKKLENFESENSPGKENRINVEIEVKKEDSKKIEISKNSDESSKPKEKANDSKSVKSSRIDSRKDKKRPNTSKTSETQAKRRKRIQVMSDSESDEENENEENEVAPASPPPPQAALIESDDEIIPPTPILEKKKSKPGRHRVKKQVSKTFVDEEGFMVTKKVMESCSETDEEPDSTNAPDDIKDSAKEPCTKLEVKKAAPSIKPKAMVAQNNKQSSIMSFFQKK